MSWGNTFYRNSLQYINYRAGELVDEAVTLLPFGLPKNGQPLLLPKGRPFAEMRNFARNIFLRRDIYTPLLPNRITYSIFVTCVDLAVFGSLYADNGGSLSDF